MDARSWLLGSMLLFGVSSTLFGQAPPIGAGHSAAGPTVNSSAIMPAASSHLHVAARPLGRRLERVESENFIVVAPDPALAREVATAAEAYRRDLAIYWLGEELPPWNVVGQTGTAKCPIIVQAGRDFQASGVTGFHLQNGTVHTWNMEVRGTPERILDSVLPHEVTHTVLATYFAPLDKHLPRWADEGICSTVEHASERSKHDQHLTQYLQTGRGLPFAEMFTLVDYPPDILPLYAQGYSVCAFLIAQGGPQKFIDFLETGLETENWPAALKTHYEYPTVGKLQTSWNSWVAAGGGNTVEKYAGSTLYGSGAQLAGASSEEAPAAAAVARIGREPTVASAPAAHGDQTTILARPAGPSVPLSLIR